jgi:hypothetical protein
MDSKKASSKTKPSSSQSHAANNMRQQMALAQQMGIPPAFLDPSLFGAAAAEMMNPANLEAQQLMALQAAAVAGMPMIDPTTGMPTAAAYGALGAPGVPAGFSPGLLPGNMGANDWMAMTQQAQMLAAMGLGGAMPPPNLLQSLYGVNPYANPAKPTSQASSSASSKPSWSNTKDTTTSSSPSTFKKELKQSPSPSGMLTSITVDVVTIFE